MDWYGEWIFIKSEEVRSSGGMETSLFFIACKWGEISVRKWVTTAYDKTPDYTDVLTNKMNSGIVYIKIKKGDTLQ